MQRREFLTKSCVAGMAVVGGGALLAQASEIPPRQPNESWFAYEARKAKAKLKQKASQTIDAVKRTTENYYELRRYDFDTQDQRTAFDKYMSDGAIPACNRQGIKPVGVFGPEQGFSPVYVLLPHKTLASFVSLAEKLSADKDYAAKAADFLNAPAAQPAYKNIEVQLLAPLPGMTQIETPTNAAGRVFQLRTYESPSEKAGVKKIEMFDTQEIAIFRKVGLHPVFFGQTVAGGKMPSLTYMLGFKDRQESDDNWKKFRADPDWQKISALPEYADKELIRTNGITNLYLTAASYSQI